MADQLRVSKERLLHFLAMPSWALGQHFHGGFQATDPIKDWRDLTGDLHDARIQIQEQESHIEALKQRLAYHERKVMM